MDIIKSGGYKIRYSTYYVFLCIHGVCVCVCSSALEIERVILEHSLVSECAVIGIQDEDLGQKVVAIVVPTSKNHELVSSLWTMFLLHYYYYP